MTNNEYLQKILQSQTFTDDSDELKALQDRRAEVENLLRKHFEKSTPTIRYGGSKAKGTMIRESYDLDIICYFSNDDTEAGETLEDIYNNTCKALEKQYLVEQKSSALRLKDRNSTSRGIDFHIDVVPGRFTDNSETDAYLHRSSGDKERLKTNLDTHIKHVKDSKVTDAIRLLKLWKVRNGINIRNFVLELLVIKLLKGKADSGLATQLENVWKEFRDNSEKLSVEDPANPTGNDLSELLNDSIRSELSSVAQRTLKMTDDLGWESIFGAVDERTENTKKEGLRRAAEVVTKPNKPWSLGE